MPVSLVREGARGDKMKLKNAKLEVECLEKAKMFYNRPAKGF